MSEYVIEDGYEVPARRITGIPPGPRTKLTATLEGMRPGQSVLVKTPEEAKAAEQYRFRARPRDYIVRKIPRQGWRVWRVV